MENLELGEEALGAGSHGMVLGLWGKNLGWDGDAGGKGGLSNFETGKLHKVGGSAGTEQGLPVCEIGGKGDRCGRMLGKP